ncbi:MAG: hypothetical protein ABIJ57_01020 [Pseudomonadota bacterium]
MKKEERSNFVNIPKFKTKEVSGITFGGFGLDRFMASNKKLTLWGRTLPQAMIVAADKGKGWHLLTAFEWAAMAYLWKNAKSPDELEFDIHAETWQWVMGLFMDKEGHVNVLGSLDVSYNGSPYGRGTIKSLKGNPILIVDGTGLNWLKKWDEDAFSGMLVYVAEANGSRGEFYPIDGNSINSLSFDISPIPDPKNGQATFCIVKHISKDITSDMDSGNRIISLRASDPDLKPFAIPGGSNSTGDPKYGMDRYWFYKDKIARAALRGGGFNTEARAGVFSLDLDSAPSYSCYAFGFRAAKAL